MYLPNGPLGDLELAECWQAHLPLAGERDDGKDGGHAAVFCFPGPKRIALLTDFVSSPVGAIWPVS